MEAAVHEIPGKLRVAFDMDAKAIIDRWETFAVTLEEFRDAVLIRGVTYGSRYGVRAWIVDSSAAKGAFPPAVQLLIEKEVFPTFAKIGVKQFLTITSKSAITNLSIMNFVSKLGPNGIELIETGSVSDALTIIKNTKR
ncbi:MAG TPA: hypothetical protein VIV60_23655 [Polyangiaceae bacterium]